MNSGARFSAVGRMRAVMLSVSLAVSLSSIAAETQTAVIPPENENTPGRGRAVILAEGIRYMGVYNPAEFLSSMSEGGTISAIGFRLDELVGGSAHSFNFPDVEIRMSTIIPVNGPPSSHVYSDYVGADETIVFRGSLQWETPPNSNGVNPFALDIQLQSPFTLDPRFESLVIDIRTYEETTLDNFRVDTTGPESSSFSLSGPIARPDAVLFYLDPPIMKIEFVPVPEPSSRALLLLGFALLGSFGRTRVNCCQTVE